MSTIPRGGSTSSLTHIRVLETKNHSKSPQSAQDSSHPLSSTTTHGPSWHIPCFVVICLICVVICFLLLLFSVNYHALLWLPAAAQITVRHCSPRDMLQISGMSVACHGECIAVRNLRAERNTIQTTTHKHAYTRACTRTGVLVPAR